jgi:hypothetical protein
LHLFFYVHLELVESSTILRYAHPVPQKAVSTHQNILRRN